MTNRFEKLPPLMKEAIQVLQDLHHTPIELAMPAVLGVANLATMPHYKVDSIQFGEIPISLYILCILNTGLRKTTNFNEVIKGIKRFVDNKQIEFQNEHIRFKLEENRYKKKLKKYEDELEAFEKSSAILTQPVQPIPPSPIQSADYTITTGTWNGIVDLLKTQPFVGLFSSEAGEFFNSHAFQGTKNDMSKAMEMATKLTNMWSGEVVEKLTGEEKVRLRNRYGNMMFFLQETSIRDVLSNPAFSDQGFAHRLLISQTNQLKKKPMDLSERGQRLIEEERMKLKKFHDRTYELISQPLTFMGNSKLELNPRIIRMNNDAIEILQKFNNDNLNRGDEDLKSYDGFAQRLFEHALRIAGTLAAFEFKKEIDKDDAECAVEIMDFFIEQRKNLELGVKSSNESHKNKVTKLKEWMIRKAESGVKSWTERQIRQNVRWFGEQTFQERSEILTELVAEKTLELKIVTISNSREVKTYELLEENLV